MNGVFGDLPEQPAPACGALSAGGARLRVPVRDEVRLEVVDLEALIGEDHAARLIWAYVERRDFTDFEAKVRAREGLPGMPQTSPRLLLALWLYATSDGVGSAREMERLCGEGSEGVFEQVPLILEQTDRSVEELAGRC